MSIWSAAKRVCEIFASPFLYKENIDVNSLAHTKWNYKYHIVFAPKYRRKIFYEEKRLEIREIFRQLCRWKGVIKTKTTYYTIKKVQYGRKGVSIWISMLYMVCALKISNRGIVKHAYRRYRHRQ